MSLDLLRLLRWHRPNTTWIRWFALNQKQSGALTWYVNESNAHWPQRRIQGSQLPSMIGFAFLELLQNIHQHYLAAVVISACTCCTDVPVRWRLKFPQLSISRTIWFYVGFQFLEALLNHLLKIFQRRHLFVVTTARTIQIQITEKLEKFFYCFEPLPTCMLVSPLRAQLWHVRYLITFLVDLCVSEFQVFQVLTIITLRPNWDGAHNRNIHAIHHKMSLCLVSDHSSARTSSHLLCNAIFKCTVSATTSDLLMICVEPFVFENHHTRQI